jgi:WD40 repeat protein
MALLPSSLPLMVYCFDIGKNIVSASLDGSLIVWDPKTAKAVNRWDASDGRFHQEGVTCLGVSKDSTIIVSGSSDGTVLVLHAVNGKILESFEKHDQSIESIVFANQ